MFMGEYHHNIDAKGRVIIPSKFRDELGQTFIVTKGLDKCLVIYTINEWNTFEEKIKQFPTTDQGIRRFFRFLFSGACECEPDAYGRILIPQNLRKYANISKEIAFIGVVNKVEIWSKENWETYNNEDNFIDNELAEKMTELGI
ncbi:division/cell wall cluster transcriptional repressor MraZ [[Clostridium] colinum]|uniref:division/cell wall cluster transcriptional repressor MraZ n=1 Tax=[Clostridium] colinum TaxID=36835 RepID=UPI00202517AF|nr:division/cell wall cluster transcriptional repressor MraZ [[Clostridium] colinum]